jgi:hypothetical protein
MKIKHKLVKGSVKMIKPFIYGVSIENKYDRAMLFCRYQEFYESPFNNIRGKYFTLNEFMKTYTKENGHESFTYPSDWSGYNIPSNVLDKAHDKFYKETEYDEIMNDIIFYCANDAQQCNDGTRANWYLIGYGGDESILKHEIAHGLYYTKRSYRLEMDLLVSELPKKVFKKIKKELIKMGYVDDNKIIYDEIQAYMSTGLAAQFDGDEFRKHQDKFIEIYNYHQ